MQHRTLTTLAKLRVGDIFHYPKSNEKFIVTAHNRTFTSINQPAANGGTVKKWDDLVRGSKQVVFLRHTVPVTGETCLLSDLKDNDVFHMPDDIIAEYIIAGGCVFPLLINQKPVPPITSTSNVVFVRNDKK